MQTGAFTVCESHAPSTAVQCIKEEQRRNVTAFRDAPQAEPCRLSAADQEQTGFYNSHQCLWNSAVSDFCLPSQQQRMTHQNPLLLGNIYFLLFLQLLYYFFLYFSTCCAVTSCLLLFSVQLDCGLVVQRDLCFALFLSTR